MKLTILGTGNAAVTECYNTCFVLSEKDDYFLVDGGGGNGILHQLKHAGIDWKQVRTIFVTHKHLDHIMGIVWMIHMVCQNISRGQYEEDAVIYAHEEVIGLLKGMAENLLQKKEAAFLDKRLHLVTVEDGESKEILGKKVTFFDIHSTKAKQFGFSMELGDGKKLTCCGDEPYNEENESYAKDSTWLLHEAFCLYGQADIFKPYEKHHSTVKDACELAERLGVKNLLLYHTEDKNIAWRKELYLEEGRKYYSGNLYVPDDLEQLKLDEGEKIQLRDGREVVLREAEPEDAESMIAYLRQTAAETHFMVRLPEEVDFTLEEEERILRNIRKSDKDLMLAAFDGDRVVGNVGVHIFHDRTKVRHRSSLGIAIIQEYCSFGLGTILMERGIDFAKKAGFEQLELGVFADNDRALCLYKKMGFEEIGRIPRAFRLPDGSYIDEITMVKML